MADTLQVPLWQLAITGLFVWGAYTYGEERGRTSKERLQKKVDARNAELTLFLPKKGGGYYRHRSKQTR